MKKVELLAPAGSMEAFRGAVNAGADAVYLAGQQFGARAYAQNFTEEELKDVLKTAHLFHVKIYLTVNVLTRETELPELVQFVSRLYEAGLDGVIVQDLGVADALRQACPELLLHASTQMSVTGRWGAQFLLNHGFSRVVPARELSLDEIRFLKETGIEVEAFIHGAMCYCYSGRCLMSSFLGGRSGNRGRCAGPCRLPYEIIAGYEPVQPDGRDNTNIIPSAPQNHPQGSSRGKTIISRKNMKSAQDGAGPAWNDRSAFRDREELYPLSMRDMCVLPILPDLMDAGIDSFKIEGRMKKPEYAAGTTAIYRKYIDRFYEWDAKGRPGRWKIEDADLKELHQLYIRTDLSTGYYHERNGRDMLTIGKPGYAGADPDKLQEIREKYVAVSHNLPITGHSVIRAGQKAELRVSVEPGNSSTALPVIENAPIRPHAVEKTGKSVSGGKRETAETFSETKDRKMITVLTEGETVQSAQSRPLSEQNIREKLMKTGDSPFAFLRAEDLKVETDGQSFLPVSQLNALRRDALEKLEQELLKPYEGRKAQPFRNRGSEENLETPHRQQKLVMVQTMVQARAALESGPDILVVDGPLRDAPDEIIQYINMMAESAVRHQTTATQIRIMAALPHVLRASDEAWLRDYVGRYGNIFYGFITRNPEELEFLKQIGYSKRVIADSGLYAWNTQGLVVLSDYCSYNVLPLELDRHELWNTFGKNGILHGRMILTVYGRAPLMISANCVRKTMGRCLVQRKGSLAEEHSSDSVTEQDTKLFWCGLRDRTGTIFPVQTDCRHCQNIIYNSVPTSLHKFSDDPVVRNAAGILYSFTGESGEEVKRILSGSRADVSFTSGHFRKGAL